MADNLTAIACRAICQSGKFETGQGTCAPICMEFLGDPRKSGCGHAVRVHGKMAEDLLNIIANFRSE